MDWEVTLFDTTVDAEEIAAVTDVLSSRWLSMGGITQTFEQEFAEHLGVSESVAVSSGTAALHLAMLALGIGEGDEVLIPSMSFVASAAVVALSGARPVFVDVKGTYDLTLDPIDVERRITPRTKALVVMHYGGYACDMDALLEIARTHHIRVIEDAAHAPLVRFRRGMLGTFGDIGCFSFFATKNMTTGEGGMVVARDPALMKKVRLLRSHCMTTSSWDKQNGRVSSYDVNGLGLNYRITEAASAMGRIQLDKLVYDRQHRHHQVQLYRSLLQPLSEIEMPFSERQEDSAYHLFPILLPPHVKRQDIQEGLKRAGIQSSVHYPPTHLFSYYQQHYGYHAGQLPITEDIAERELTLPLHARLTDAQVTLVAATLCELLVPVEQYTLSK